MSNSIMYQQDAYVVLEAGQPEQILTKEELFDKLKNFIINYPEELPRELQKSTDLETKTTQLMENYYEFNLNSDQYLQWYVIRLEK